MYNNVLGTESHLEIQVTRYTCCNGNSGTPPTLVNAYTFNPHLKNFSLFRTNEGEYLLSPAYDLMSTVIHTPYEHDTALSLYEGDLESDRYATYGSYGRDNFMELAERLGILAARAARMLDYFPAQESRIAEMVERSFLSAAVKERYMLNVQDKLRRLR